MKKRYRVYILKEVIPIINLLLISTDTHQNDLLELLVDASIKQFTEEDKVMSTLSLML